MEKYVGAIDLGTTSCRFILFDRKGRIFESAQKEHRQIYPKPGWVEHDPMEIWQNTCQVITQTLEKANITADRIDSVGITNQRETCVIWDKKTGQPCHNAVVWQCTRSDEICTDLEKKYSTDFFRSKTGLPVASYFSGPKITWLLRNIPEISRKKESGEIVAGTIESWIVWWLTGGPDGGSHITDVSNASRTMLMNIHTLEWDPELADAMEVPLAMLPEIRPSVDSRTWGSTLKTGPFQGAVPVCAALGDQQSALFGQTCFSVGEAKNTYGTGCFLLLNTGTTAVESRHGLLTTVAYQINREETVYCLEGSIAIAGSLVQWMRDNMRMISSASEIEPLARSVEDNGDIYFVPAFSGLYAPYWRSDARGIIAGLTGFAQRGHVARAVLEACAFQTKDIAEAMDKDSGVALKLLKVDGGMVINELLMQFQSDILNVPLIRPKVIETTALGAAYAAGLATGFWPSIHALKENWEEDKQWHPDMDEATRAGMWGNWKKAIEKSYGWK